MQALRHWISNQRPLTYPAPQPYPPGWIYFKAITVYPIAVLSLAVLAVVNAALVWHETVTAYKPDFNITQSFWFDHLTPARIRRARTGTLCEPLTLNPGDSFTTNYSLFQWDLVTVSGPQRSDKSLIYKGSTLQSCDVRTQYMDAHVQEGWGNAAIVIECDNVDGFKFLAKTSFSLSTLSGMYNPPLLGAIPDNILFGNGSPTERSRSTLLNNLLRDVRDDFTPLYDQLLLGPPPHPMILSGRASVAPCPASNETCATKPPTISIDAVTAVFSDAPRIDYKFPPLVVIDGFLGVGMQSAILNQAQSGLAAVRIDLGNPGPNNFLLNRSVIDATISRMIDSTESKLYRDAVNQANTMPPMMGPATIQGLYSCQWQQARPIASAFVLALVATLSMFLSGWGSFWFLAATYAEYTVRIRPTPHVAQVPVS